VLGDAAHADTVGWLGLGVALTVAAASQTALLNGMRRIGDLARVNVGAAVLSTLAAVGIAVMWGERGILAFVLAGPVASFLLGHWYVARMGRLQVPPTGRTHLFQQWRTLLRLGLAFMVSGMVVNLGQLLARTLIQRELGPESLGHFQAAWTISMTYLGFVLGAMGMDYYPRLTAVIREPEKVNQLVNEQTEVALLLAGPAFLAMLALAPWLVRLLYSAEFAEAANILRWQVLGDVLKVAAWPLGFILLAAGNGRTFMFTESLAISIFVLGVALGLPWLGIASAGIAFLVMYIAYLPLVWVLAKKRTTFYWQPSVWKRLLLLFLAALVVAGLGMLNDTVAAVVGLLLAAIFALDGLARLANMAGLQGPVGRLASVSCRLMMRVRVWRGE
jgi:PST family polysaccharide transporter